MSVDPLADAPLNVGTSPYTYVWNNPLKFVDPDGRHGQGVENTIYYDTDGNELGRTEDNLDNAIVVVNDVDAFNKINGGNLTGDEKASALRGTGTNYMVDGMINLLNTSMADPSPQEDMHDDFRFFNSSGGYDKNIKSEWGGFLVEKNGSVQCSDCTFTDYNPWLVSGNSFSSNITDENIVGKIHTHPNSGQIGLQGNGDRVRFTFSPSAQDKRNSSYQRSGYFEAVIDTKSIHLYNGSTTITSPLNFFKK